MFSATWPEEVDELAQDFMTNFTKITMGSEKLRANTRIRQHIKFCGTRDKEAA